MTELAILRSFVAVAEELHFARAAERLHMAQSPLSQQIRRLERELDTRLFERTTRHVEMTPAGELLLSRAKEIIAAVDSACQEAREAAAGERGHLEIGFTGSASFALMPAISAALRRQIPGATLNLRGNLLTATQVTDLLAGTLHLGVLRPPVHEKDLNVEVIVREPLIAALPEDHPLALTTPLMVEQFQDEPFVCFPEVSALRGFAHDLCAAHGFTPTEAHVTGEASTLIAFVAAGMGVSLVPASVSRLTVAGAVYRPLVKTAEVELALGWHRDLELPTLNRAIEVIRATIDGLVLYEPTATS